MPHKAFIPAAAALALLSGCQASGSLRFTQPDILPKAGGLIGGVLGGPVGEAVGTDFGYILAAAAGIYGVKKRGDVKTIKAANGHTPPKH